jgi:streptogramin lyase
MRPRPTILITILTLTLFGAVMIQASAPTFEEADLLSYSDPYEVNPAAGGVYVSDPGAGDIWHVLDSGAYTRYQLGVEVVDAQTSASGEMWWTDALDGFGYITPSAGTVTRWALGDFQNLGGLAFDQAGGVWLTQYFGREVYRFDPATTELCAYGLGAPSYYVLAGDGPVWLGQWSNDRIYRLDPAGGQATWWQIPGDNAWPVGLAPDSAGALWWADKDLGVLARLEPDQNRLTTYSPPLGGEPQMVALRQGRLWYTESGAGTVGVLDPALASGTTVTVTSGSTPLEPECASLGAGTTLPVETVTGNLDWGTQSLEPSVDAGGWTVYELPAGGSPFGIAGSGGYVWVADQGRQKLMRFEAPETTFVFLPFVAKRSSQ